MISVRDAVSYRKRQQKLKDLKPKLQVIEKRMKSLGNADATALSTERADGSIKFNAQKLFEMLDEDGNGELSYEELNLVMQLKPMALREFTHRMNQAAREPEGTKTISRAVFAKHFLNVLEVSQQFEPSPAEAAQLFDEIAKVGKTSDGDIPYRVFFMSPMAEFLNDAQINDLLKRFQKIKETEGGDEEAKSSRGLVHNMSIRAMDHTVGIRRRQSSLLLGGTTRSRVISKKEFVAKYPQLLIEVIDPKTDQAAELFEKESVDIAFQNLCLTVKVKDSSIKVVNDVTGRLQAGTMTALMGGSGAGRQEAATVRSPRLGSLVEC